MNAVSDLYLHAGADGFVWYEADGAGIQHADFKAVDLATGFSGRGIQLDRVSTIRLLGLPVNAPLIVALHQRRTRKPSLHHTQSIRLGNPVICQPRNERFNPERVLQHMRQPHIDRVVPGCWHELTDKDYCTYTLILAMAENNGTADDRCRRILRYHPSWPALSFLPTLDMTAACKVVATVVDPQWYRHPFHPHRNSRLESYLGLTPDNMAAFLGTGKPTRHYERAATVISAWCGREPWAKEHEFQLPANFLWRIFRSHVDRVKGLLRACQHFLRFLREVWIHEASTHRREAYFLSALFFRNQGEAKAWISHRAALKSV